MAEKHGESEKESESVSLPGERRATSLFIPFVLLSLQASDDRETNLLFEAAQLLNLRLNLWLQL